MKDAAVDAVYGEARDLRSIINNHVKDMIRLKTESTTRTQRGDYTGAFPATGGSGPTSYEPHPPRPYSQGHDYASGTGYGGTLNNIAGGAQAVRDTFEEAPKGSWRWHAKNLATRVLNSAGAVATMAGHAAAAADAKNPVQMAYHLTHAYQHGQNLHTHMQGLAEDSKNFEEASRQKLTEGQMHAKAKISQLKTHLDTEVKIHAMNAEERLRQAKERIEHMRAQARRQVHSYLE
jgi:hypothetical protein